MKKTLLSIGLGLTAAFAANAQVSFEESEGFTVGPLSGQNGWGVSAAAPTSSSVSADYANDGVNSLKVMGLDAATHALVGAFSPVEPIDEDIITVSYDIYVAELSATASDFFVGAQSPSQALLTSREHFNYQGMISVVATNPDTAGLEDIDTGSTYEPGQWYNMTAVHTFSAGTIEYFLDGIPIFTGDAFGATNIEQMTFLNDNYNSTAYMDNLQVVGGLGIDQNAVAKLSVYPNPANNFINISNPDNIQINFVNILDLNGRMVKQVKLNAVSEATVDISELATGTYMVKIVSDKGSSVKKIVKS